MFREIREAKKGEKNLTKRNDEGKIDITKRIKPENMTVDEAFAYWDELFNTQK